VAGQEDAAVVRIRHEHVGLLEEAVHVDFGDLTGLLGLQELHGLLGEARKRRQAGQILLGHDNSLVQAHGG
jgi:hypothetical protein